MQIKSKQLNGDAPNIRVQDKLKGFTLVELLVVIAVLALLAAILFPVLLHSREAARRGSCASQLKQIGMAIVQYTQDYDELYPYCAWLQRPSEPDNTMALGKVLEPYHKHGAFWRCPSDSLHSGPVDASYHTASYAYNTWYFCHDGRGPADPPHSMGLSSLNNPSDVAIAWGAWTTNSGQSFIFDHPNGGQGYPCSRIEGSPFSTDSSIQRGHLQGGNFCYADGHVKWQSSATIQQQIMAARTQAANTVTLFGEG